jgi:hypothetical protein
MLTKFFLVISSSGKVRTVKSQPSLSYDEISISMNLNVPNRLFEKPLLHAEITVPESAATPKNIDVEMTDNIQAAIEEATGLQVKLSIVDPEVI